MIKESRLVTPTMSDERNRFGRRAYLNCGNIKLFKLNEYRTKNLSNCMRKGDFIGTSGEICAIAQIFNLLAVYPDR